MALETKSNADAATTYDSLKEMQEKGELDKIIEIGTKAVTRLGAHPRVMWQVMIAHERLGNDDCLGKIANFC